MSCTKIKLLLLIKVFSFNADIITMYVYICSYLLLLESTLTLQKVSANNPSNTGTAIMKCGQIYM